MYNRYIPQADGTYRKNYIPDCPAPPPKIIHEAKPVAVCDPNPQDPCPPPIRPHTEKNDPPRQENKACSNSGALSFLQNLLPRDLDTGDLLVIILLLLMAGDCKDSQNTALLTLALYLFL